MRKLELYLKKYGEETGRKLYHTLQSQAAHAGVSARLRRKLQSLSSPTAGEAGEQPSLPLFDSPDENRDEVPSPAMAAPCHEA